MSRLSLKRTYDAYDSPASSTPPPGAKRYHFDSDASSDSFALHLPSDSPSNPFGRCKPFVPRTLPRPIPISDHLVLRFQLASQPHSVHRIVSVPVNYTFWHLSRLTQFLFGWKDFRTERGSHGSHEKIRRRVEHAFTVQKRIALYAAPRHAGLIKSGETVVRVAGNIKGLKPRCKDDITWEREEYYKLQHLWHRPGSSSEMSRAIIYDYDVLSSRKELVHITISSESNKLRTLQQDLKDPSNMPHVLLGQGLPNDDEDDEDFALDLQQWNEPLAFENYIVSQEEDEENDEDDDSASPIRLAEEQARVKQRMSAPLPKHLPIDEEEDQEDDAPPKFKLLAKATDPKAPVKKRASLPLATRLPDPDESREVGVYYPEERKDASALVLGHSPTKKRATRLPDPDESREVGAWSDDGKKVEKKARATNNARSHVPAKPAAPFHPVKQVLPRAGNHRVVSGEQTREKEHELAESETEL
ncbi:hypothetical protein M0805_000602 [Coniferiporia weirii]|nr:hypothetical protein M0805_000602 [Coniferiporia weirii]